MKKIWLFIIILMFIFTGCKKDPLSEYINAHYKTNEIENKKTYFELTSAITFNDEGLSEKEKIQKSYYDKIEFIFDKNVASTDKKYQSIINIYYNLGGVGFNSNVYINGEEIYMKIPVLDKYLDLTKEENIENDLIKPNDVKVYQQLLSEFVEEWIAILRRENVVVGERNYITTDEGQIKTYTYKINVSDKQLKYLISEFKSRIEENDEVLAETIKLQGISEENLDEIIENINNIINKLQFDYFQGLAYVDFDGRLVKEEYEVLLSIKDNKPGEVKTMKLNFFIEYSNFEEEQVLEFPNITEDMWFDINSIEIYKMENIQNIFAN